MARPRVSAGIAGRFGGGVYCAALLHYQSWLHPGGDITVDQAT